MDDDARARNLLSGPRGRRLAGELLAQPLYVHGHAGGDWSAELRRRVASTEPSAAGRPDRLAKALAATVGSARYWQEPDEEDIVIQDEAVAAELTPIAAAVAASAASAWWTEPLALDDQHVVAWADEDGISRPVPPAPVPRCSDGETPRWPRRSVPAESDRPIRVRPGPALGGPRRCWPAWS